MSCKEIQRQLDECSGRNVELSDEIKDHLSRCEDCSRVAKSASKLGRIFKTAADEPESDLMSLDNRVRMVAREAESVGWAERLSDMAGRVADAISFGHRRLAMYSSLITVVLVFVTFVPFGYNRVVGYDLTIGGICPEVAEDHEIVCALLYEQGVEQPVINVTDCDTTCSLIVFDLKSEREIEVAMATYEELGAEATIENVTVVTDRGRRSLLRMAHERIFSN